MPILQRSFMLALALSILAAACPQAVAAERFLVVQAAGDGQKADGEWRRRPARPRLERPDRPRRSERGPVMLIAPTLVFPMGGGREVAPPPDYRPGPRTPAKQKAAKPNKPNKPNKPGAAAKPRAAKAKSSPPKKEAAVSRPPVGPHVESEVLFTAPSPEISDAVLKRHRLTRLESAELALTGTTVVRARVAKGSNPVATLRALRADKALLSSELNHLFALQAEVGAPRKGDLAAVQYAPAKLRLEEAHALAEGDKVRVAVIDSGVDADHPELAGSLDPASGATTVGSHGTGVAGVIAAHQRLTGVAPKVQILAFDPFVPKGKNDVRGTTLDILKSLDKAATAGARIVNLSFAGPSDVMLSAGLAAADARGMILIAAAGNGGPKAKPAFPAAYPAVIAVTATDASDAIYASAPRGGHIALAAPGVDILTAAPGQAYAQLSGTSFAAAQVTGVAALLLESAPALTPETIRTVLTRSARDLGKPGRDDVFGAGLVDAAAALSALAEVTASAAMR